MSLEVLDTSVVPRPSGWTYYVQSTNYTVKTQIYSRIYPEVVKHCLANGVNPPTWQEVVDQMCRELSIPCHESTGGEAIINKWTLGLPTPALKGCCG